MERGEWMRSQCVSCGKVGLTNKEECEQRNCVKEKRKKVLVAEEVLEQCEQSMKQEWS